MFFDIGWPEFLLIGVIALVVIGPKDLPAALRVAGYWVRKARMLSREFQNSVEQMIRDAELDEVRQDLKKATEFNLESEFQKTIDPTGSLAESIRPPELPDFFDTTPTGGEPAADIAAVEAQAALEAAAAAEPQLPAPVGDEPLAAEAEADLPELPGLNLPPVRRPEPSNP